MFKKGLILATLVFLVASAFGSVKPSGEFVLQDGNCPSAPARLKQGNIAVVTVGDGETLNLRVFPGLDQEIITKIPAYTYVTIIAGPICDEGYRWFEVGWEGKDGWSAEVGPDGEYNMIPNGDPVPNSSTNPIPNPFGYTPSPIFKLENGEYYFEDWENSQLRKIPNLDTLEALGFPKDEIDSNQGSLEGATYGPDVPDIHNDPDGFCTFKYKYFPSYPNPSWSPCGMTFEQPTSTQTPTPLIEAPIETIEEPFFCGWWIIGWLACDLAEANSANARCEPQCMTEMRKEDFRPDMNEWSKGTGNSDPNDVLVNAEKMPTYTIRGTEEKLQVRVRAPDESPQVGDLIIWPDDCGGANKSTGHIGQVITIVSVTVIDVHDSNWDNTCTPNDRQIQILSCMRFVTMPFPAGTYTPVVQTPVTSCDQYQGWQNFACQHIPWWKP